MKFKPGYLLFFFILLSPILSKSQFAIDSVVTVDVMDCYGASSGSISIYVSGGTPPYSYSIKNISGTINYPYQAGNVFTGLPSDTYSVFAKDFFQTKSLPTYIDQPDDIFISNVTHTNVTGCYGGNNGTITITASGGTGALEYSINNGANYFANGGIFTDLTGGTYFIKVRDANLCVKNGPSRTVGQPLPLVISDEDVTDVMGCSGDANGSIDIITTGGTAPIYCSIDGGGTFGSANQHYFSPLPPGTYPVVVRDNNGCITPGSDLILSEPLPVTIDDQSSTNISTCFGDHTGTITLLASGGTGTLYYSIDGGVNFQNNGNFNNLYAGTYEIIVQDENLCIVNGADIIISQPDQIIIDSEIKTDVLTCFGDATGQIVINAHGGVAPLEYSVNSGATYQASNIVSGLVSGTYSTIVRDANLCEVIGTDHLISQPIQLVITNVYTTDVSTCYGGNDGTMSITTNGGGTQPYSFSIDGGATFPYGNNINGLFAGIYNVVVRDVNNCTDAFTDYVVDITEPNELLIISEVPSDPTCFEGTNGTITVTTNNGGTGQIQYSPDNGTTWYYGNILSGLSAGTVYQIRVKDSHNCETPGGTHILGEPSELILDTIIKQDVIDCFGGSNGSITINVSGGTPAYQYSINGGSTFQASNIFTGLIAGNYPVIVKDVNQCNVYGGTIVLNQPGVLQVSFQTHTNILGCHGDLIGQIHFDAIGGTPNVPNGYEYSVNGGANYYYNNGDFMGLGAGTYQLTVRDENGCLANGQPITITEPNELIPSLVSQQNVLCYGGNTGFINLMATGGQTPFYFSVDSGYHYQTGTFFSGLIAGDYQTFVKDQYNCIEIGPLVTITQPDSLIVSNVTVTNIDGCYGDHDGIIAIDVINGTAPYYWSIDNGNSYYNDNGGIFSNLGPDNYYVRIYDANACTGFADLDNNGAVDTFLITQPAQLRITDYDKTDISCFGETDGSIQIIATGGTGTIYYSIDNGLSYPNTTGFFDNLAQGTYTIKIMDDNGCTSPSYPVGIYEPEQFVITNVLVQNETCPGFNNGSIRFYIDGGTFPYQFSADNGLTYQDYNIIGNLAPGTYYPAAIDINGCTAVYPEVTVEPGIHAGLFTADVTEGCSPLDVQFTRLSPGVTYLWDFGDGEISTQNEPMHTFYDSLTVPQVYTVTAYSLSPANCTDTTYAYITVYPQPQLLFTADPDTLYYPDATTMIENNSPVGYTGYFWDFGDGSSSNDEQPVSHTYGDCGEYLIRLGANNTWCTDTVEHLIVVTTFQPDAFFETDTTQSCYPVTINFTNQSMFITDFIWDLGDGSTSNDNVFSYTYETPGEYLVSLNANGWCGTSDTYDTLITVFDSPTVDFEVFPDSVMLPGQPIHCTNLSSDDSEYFYWNFGDGGYSTLENPVWQYTEAGTYSVSLIVTSFNNCIDSLSLTTQVTVLPEGKVLFPNAFTPDNDGINDVFVPAVYESVLTFRFEVFNRWGELMFYSTDLNTGWNGYFNGKLAAQDVYVWRMEGIYINGTPFEFAGNVTLIR
jgi:gliding motility-associated-like protein